MICIKLNRIPTGIQTFDSIIRGGFPSGSVVLLAGEAGAGNTEFAYTCGVMHSRMKKNPENLKSVNEQLRNLLQKDETLKFPEKICYISFARAKEDILTELGHTYPPEFASSLSENMFFKELSPNSLFHASNDKDWLSINALKSVDEEREIMRELVNTLDANASNSLVIIDSLTSLFHTCNRFLNWNDRISFLEELQRKSKKWDGLVYLLLGKGIFESMKEEEMMDVADGALVFEWVEESFSRQQAMYMKKFRGVMPHIARDFIIRFDTTVTNTDGFVVTNVKRIFGRK